VAVGVVSDEVCRCSCGVEEVVKLYKGELVIELMRREMGSLAGGGKRKGGHNTMRPCLPHSSKNNPFRNRTNQTLMYKISTLFDAKYGTETHRIHLFGGLMIVI
jgi:hypothetical protein